MIMGTPVRKDIVSNIGSVLATITTDNGYKTTVVTVEAVGKTWADVGSGAKPWIGYAPVRESFEYFPGSQIRVVLNVTIIAHISGTTQADRATKLNDLLDDIIAALNLDTTRGGKAIATTITTVETDEGSPDANGFGSMVLTVDVPYIRTLSAS
tara:strand:+ start:1641 stop:2102 length:462 start_codon:yes stop_codon:yes gene_type:complete